MRALETALLSAPPHKTRTSAAASSPPAEATGASGTAYLAAAAPAAAPSAETTGASGAAHLAAPAAQAAAQISF